MHLNISAQNIYHPSKQILSDPFTCSVSFNFLCGSSSEGECGLLGAAPLRPLVKSDELVLGELIRGITFRPTTVGMVLPVTGNVGMATWLTAASKVGERDSTYDIYRHVNTHGQPSLNKKYTHFLSL